MFNSSTISDAVGTVPEFDSAEVDSIVEVQMRSSQPLPDKMGILNGKYLAGSNESQLIYLTSSGEYRIISMEDLDTICRTPAQSGKAKDAQLIEASQPYTHKPCGYCRASMKKALPATSKTSPSLAMSNVTKAVYRLDTLLGVDPTIF